MKKVQIEKIRSIIPKCEVEMICYKLVRISISLFLLRKFVLEVKEKHVKAGGDGVEWDSQTKYIKINELKSFGTNY